MGISAEDREFFSRLPTQYRERVERILAEWVERRRQEIEELDAKQACHFPEHRHWKYDHVTHMKQLGMLNGMDVSVCVVCGSVHAHEPVVLA